MGFNSRWIPSPDPKLHRPGPSSTVPGIPVLEAHCFGILSPPVSQAVQQLENRDFIVIDRTGEETSQWLAPLLGTWWSISGDPDKTSESACYYRYSQ